MRSLHTAAAAVVLTALLTAPALGAVPGDAPFYVLQGVDKTVPDNVLSTPGVDGFAIRVSWRRLHEQGFGWLDNQVARANRLNRQLQLRVMGGAFAPQALPGVAYFNYVDFSHSGFGSSPRAPVPWDPDLHAAWRSMAQRLGQRYGRNGRIRVVHVPGFANSSEMHMPSNVQRVPGYSSRALAESWIAMAEPLVGAFPSAILSLNYTTPRQAQLSGPDSSWVLDELARIAGPRAGYQANDLSAKVSLKRNKYKVLVRQSQLGRHVGFQMLSASSSGRFGGDFEEAVETGLEAGAEWFEVYRADVNRLPK